MQRDAAVAAERRRGRHDQQGDRRDSFADVRRDDPQRPYGRVIAGGQVRRCGVGGEVEREKGDERGGDASPPGKLGEAVGEVV